jgi:hypothetical protein
LVEGREQRGLIGRAAPSWSHHAATPRRLALVASSAGYSCVFVCPDKVSEDKRNVGCARTRRVVVCTAVEPSQNRTATDNVSDLAARVRALEADVLPPRRPRLAL